MTVTTTRIKADDALALLALMHVLVTRAQSQRDPCKWLHDELLEMRQALTHE